MQPSRPVHTCTGGGVDLALRSAKRFPKHQQLRRNAELLVREISHRLPHRLLCADWLIDYPTVTAVIASTNQVSSLLGDADTTKQDADVDPGGESSAAAAPDPGKEECAVM